MADRPSAAFTPAAASDAAGGSGSFVRVLITAGPTHEPIDQVRYIANRSSGRMGIALAEAALARGWSVTLLLGPTCIDPPSDSHCRVQRFRTATELQQQVQERWPSHDVLFMAAAVADYTPAASPDRAEKIKRSAKPLSLELIPTPDIVEALARTKRSNQFIVGFALEASANLEAEAVRKMQRKGLDAVIANPLETMDAEQVCAIVQLKDGARMIPPPAVSKRAFAAWLLEHLEAAIFARINVV